MICREYGYENGASAYSIDTLFQSNSKPDYIIEDLECSGDEDKIDDCQFSINWDFPLDFTNPGIFGVVCRTAGKIGLEIYLRKLCFNLKYFQLLRIPMRFWSMVAIIPMETSLLSTIWDFWDRFVMIPLVPKR